MSYTMCSRFKGEHIVYAGYTICTSREHIVYGAFCGSTGYLPVASYLYSVISNFILFSIYMKRLWLDAGYKPLHANEFS